eukprot:173240-Prymnesium_polylepis.2
MQWHVAMDALLRVPALELRVRRWGTGSVCASPHTDASRLSEAAPPRAPHTFASNSSCVHRTPRQSYTS